MTSMSHWQPCKVPLSCTVCEVCCTVPHECSEAGPLNTPVHGCAVGVNMYDCTCVRTCVLSHQSAVMGVAFSPSGEFFSSVGADEEVGLSFLHVHGVGCEG